MIFVLVLCLLLALGLGLFVVAPIASSSKGLASAAILKGFSDEEELRQALRLRDALLARLANGQAGEAAVDALNESDAFGALVSVCERLRTAELPYLPGVASARTTVSGGGAGTAGSATLTSLFIAGFLSAGVSIGSSRALAQALPNESAPAASSDGASGSASPSSETSASSMRIPGPTLVDGVAFPVLHQFVLSPREGKLHVYYLGVFNNTDGLSELKVGLPFPKGFRELRIANRSDALFEASGSAFPIMRISLKPGVNEIRGEFELDAPWGSVEWKSEGVPALPGTMLILMPEYESALRSLTENSLPALNLWPPRVVDTPDDFRSSRNQEEYNPADPNFEMLSRMPPEFTRTLVRSAPDAKPYPSFRVVGLVPSRTPLFVLGALFAACLFGIAMFTMLRAARSPGALSKA